MRKRLGGQTLGKGPCWDKRRPDSLRDWKEVRTQVHADPELGGQLTKSTSPHPKVSWGVRKAGSPPVWEVESGGGGCPCPQDAATGSPKALPQRALEGSTSPGTGAEAGSSLGQTWRPRRIPDQVQVLPSTTPCLGAQGSGSAAKAAL